MASLYSTKVTATGGRHGSIRSDDGLLEVKLALPKALGGRGDATNPEQLFARCAAPRPADDDIEVVAEISLTQNETGAFVLSAALAVTIAGVDRKTAEVLVQGADAICPYSNAIRGNVGVTITVLVR